MATTAGEILERVQALGYGADISAPQLKTLNMLHKRVINTRRWRFLGSITKSLETTPGTGVYALDTLATTQRVDAVRLVNANGEALHLEHQPQATVRDFETMWPDSGTPEYWVRIGKDLHLWPAPSGVYQVQVDIVNNPTSLTKAEDNVQVPDAHADILVWGTIMGITFRERDWDGHNFARQMYSELITEMIAQYAMTDRQTPKRVQQSGFFDKFDVEDGWLI